MNVLVIGATGGSGRAAVERLLAAGHQVTALSRHADRLAGLSSSLRTINGDATDAALVNRAVLGHDAVLITLGISENALKVRLFGSQGTPIDVRSQGTRVVIDAMRAHGPRKLVVQTSFGVGETKSRLTWLYRLLFSLLLKHQIADTETQEKLVRASGLDWVLAQPVNLTDAVETAEPFISTTGDTAKMKISRGAVGRFLVTALEGNQFVGRSVALSMP